MRERNAVAQQLPVLGLVLASGIFVGDLLGDEILDDAPIHPSLSPLRFGAMIEGDAGQVGTIIIRPASDDDGAAFERESDGGENCHVWTPELSNGLYRNISANDQINTEPMAPHKLGADDRTGLQFDGSHGTNDSSPQDVAS